MIREETNNEERALTSEELKKISGGYIEELRINRQKHYFVYDDKTNELIATCFTRSEAEQIDSRANP